MLRKKRVVTSAGLKGVRKAYEKAADADEAGVKKSFTPACATTLASVADNMLTNAGSRDAADYLGLSMSTHLQVRHRLGYWARRETVAQSQRLVGCSQP